ncbi:MAG: cation-transporting P-type ATPase [Candidatus ainarchaeum sp.]|nr:cation-transporting P-type ATPase [Candidatus ainarchaeum sp.]
MHKKFIGLTSIQAKELLEKYGPNELNEKSKISAFGILLRQVKNNFIIYLLVFATLLSFFVGKIITAFVLIGVIIMVVGTGFLQEYRADQAIKALKKMLMHISIVIRNGQEIEVNTSEIVPGDILILRTGEKVPADCEILEEYELRVNESILTGESTEVKKFVCKKEVKDENKLFMGTMIVSGKCVARTIHTGMNTKFGKIANLISNIEKEMPLQKKVGVLTKNMAIIGLGVSVLIGIIMLLRAETITAELITEILIIVIAVAVSSFPEGFPVVLTTTLSLGAHRMAKKNAIINRMSIIETLGETTVICTDKTGTITKGEMTVRNIFVNNKEINVTGTGFETTGDFFYKNKKIDPLEDKELFLLLKTGVLCNESIIEKKNNGKEYSVIGSPTEAAIMILAGKARIFREDFDNTREQEIPFSSERKIMSSLYKENLDRFVYAKGALEFLLPKCDFIQKNGKIIKLTEKEKNKILDENKKIASKSLRTIGMAYKKNNSKIISEDELIFLGFIAMEDPPREEVKQSIIECYAAGIKVKMITGDNKETAISIAKQIGLKHTRILEGNELDHITDDELTRIVDEINIFARVKPEHKLRIVRALKANNEIVTMTGDGVNDAPSLKEAHIGVAMGISGTDVSRSVADMILKDDNFASIVDAIKEGRSIFKNIQKFSSYQISANFAQVSIILFAILLGMPLPLIALQILFMNLFSDEILAITLAFNPHSKNTMTIPPRRNSKIITKKLVTLIIIAGTTITFFTLLTFYASYTIFGFSLVESRTIVFLTMVMFGITNAFNFRSFQKPTLTRSLLVNKNLFYTSILVFLTSMIIIFTPINNLFEISPIKPIVIFIIILISITIIVIFDILKKINDKTNYWENVN